VSRPLTVVEKREGLTRPLRFRIVHTGGCGHASTLARESAESFARWPDFASTLHCPCCGEDSPIAGFTWSDGSVVGS